MKPVSPLLQTIIYWQHSYPGRPEGEAHCLARVYRLPSQQGIVVLSALRDNERGLGLSLDVPGAANALQSALAPLNFDWSWVRWVTHHGSFSGYEALDQEAFCQVDLRWNGEAWKGGLDDFRWLSPADLAEIQASIELASVFEVLPSIGFPYGRM